MEHINSSGTALKAPPDLVRRVLEDIDTETDPKHPRPEWAPLICLNRVFFSRGAHLQVRFRNAEPLLGLLGALGCERRAAARSSRGGLRSGFARFLRPRLHACV